MTLFLFVSSHWQQKWSQELLHSGDIEREPTSAFFYWNILVNLCLLQTRPNMFLNKESKVICQVRKKVLSHLVWKLFKIFSLIVRVSLESREPFTPSRLLNMAQTWYVQISFCWFDLALKGGRSESREGRHHAPRSARLQHCGRGNESCPGKNSFHCKFLFLSR